MLLGATTGDNKYDLTNFYSRRVLVIDTAMMSLVDFCTNAKTPMKRSATGKCRGPADALRTVYWYRAITAESAGISAYALGKLIAPAEYKVDASLGRRIHTHSNKWIRYANGTTVPQPTLLAAAEAKFPGSEVQINHPLWRLLDREYSSQSQLARVKSGFAPHVQIEINSVTGPARWSDAFLAILHVKKLLLLTALDALGAVVYLLHEAKLGRDTLAQAGWVHCAYCALHMHGAELVKHGVALPLFHLLQENLLGSVEHGGRRYTYPSGYYLPVIELLVRLHARTQVKHISREQFLHSVSSHLYGYGAAVVTWPVSIPTMEDPPEEAVDRSETERRIFSWAYTCLSKNQPCVFFPEDAVIEKSPPVPL